MSSRRTLILVGAIAVGAVAALLVFRYVDNVESEATRENEPVEVAVVQGGIEAGTSAEDAVDQGLIVTAERRRADLPNGTVTDVDALAGLVAAIDLPNGDIVTTTKFTQATGSGQSVSRNLEEGLVAVTVGLDSIRGVANLLQPGDEVNILVVEKPDESGESADAGGGSQQASVVNHLYQKVQVLAIGKRLGEVRTDEEGNAVQSADENLVTFAVPPEAAQLIVANSTLLHLSLVPPKYEPRPVPGTPDVDPHPGNSGRTPYDELGGQP